MRCLVTGSDGFIGSHLAEALAVDHDVTGLALYNSNDQFGWLDGGKYRVALGDIRDGEQMRDLVKGHDMVFHLAAQIEVPYSYTAARSFIDTNVTGTLNILNAALNAGAKVVHTSSSEIYGTARYTPQDTGHPLQAQSPYAASKIAADKLVEAFHRTYELPAIIVRPFNNYGPRQSYRAIIPTIIDQVLNSDTIRLGNLEAKRDFTFVEDTVRAFIGLKDRPFGVYHVGSGQNVTMDELALLIQGIAGTDREVVREAERLRPNSSEVDELMAGEPAWENQVSLKEGLARTIEWFR